MYCQPKFFTLAVFAIVAGVNAHFQLQFPPPRGVFVEDNEPTFCDGYPNPAANRTEFPLTGGFITLNSEHPLWTSGVLLSTVSDPTSFNNFSQITPYAQAHGEGSFCLPFDLSMTNATGLQDGQNVTIQIVYDGGDGNLYQCADLTLSKNFTISSNITCSNASVSATATSTGAAATGSKSAALGTVPAFGIAGIVTALFGISLAM
ncbi:hypothetical protein K443DRAFT_97168 [Laccaria amethystina LaAM-08-1]|uniref:Copper acquisition factor BIM1-like domain-containing protein n=1 Tax=Laccaria amethystina LaAM-08-1 TaxID=1095629 RepID=A0A0C9XL76_9AGAR|nr:hypothetical protein K443DRAFT_97168 [Laccaria amethystina LaAM-08-1]